MDIGLSIVAASIWIFSGMCVSSEVNSPGFALGSIIFAVFCTTVAIILF